MEEGRSISPSMPFGFRSYFKKVSLSFLFGGYLLDQMTYLAALNGWQLFSRLLLRLSSPKDPEALVFSREIILLSVVTFSIVAAFDEAITACVHMP